jgi:hypothetical protein
MNHGAYGDTPRAFETFHGIGTAIALSLIIWAALITAFTA